MVNSPLEALELLEAGNYSNQDVEAFRGFANICSGNKSDDEQDIEEQDSFKNKEGEATLDDEPSLVEEPITEDVKGNDHPVVEDVETNQQIEDHELPTKEEGEAGFENLLEQNEPELKDVNPVCEPVVEEVAETKEKSKESFGNLANPEELLAKASATLETVLRDIEEVENITVVKELKAKMQPKPVVKSSVVKRKAFDNEDNAPKNKRVFVDEELVKKTLAAVAEEEERRERVDGRDQNQDKVPEKLVLDSDPECVLDVDEETKEVLVEVDKRLARKLKPHQVEGIKFMWDCCFESLEQIKAKKIPGGAILGHCMGLGKTLQSVTLIHTVMANPKVKVKRTMVICPVSVVKNWAGEFGICHQFAFHQNMISVITY